MSRFGTLTALLSAITLLAVGLVFSEPQRVFTGSPDHPAIEYSTRPARDAVTTLNRKIQEGELRLSSNGASGYLRSVLAALGISVESQVLVFSESSLQREHITKTNPRALFFNDTVAVGWVRGTDTLEVAAQDPEQGVVFYQLSQKPQEKPQFVRGTECLQCHMTSFTSGVPGMTAMSMLPLSDNQNEYAQGWAVDHRTPIEDRWGGWYVTGTQPPPRHLGNVPVHHVPQSYVRADVAPKLNSVAGEFDAAPWPSAHSDVVALLVLNHQVEMTNLLTRLGWEARIAAHNAPPAQAGAVPARVQEIARELVDYLLFVDEAPLPSKIQGSSAFAREFPAKGPRDSQGRSLRDLDLERRLLRYPCSYMIYTEAFDSLPGPAKAAVYERMWEILSGQEASAAYARLSRADRQAVVEILRETKKDLPAYFQPGQLR
jgi:hypothetical protein